MASIFMLTLSSVAATPAMAQVAADSAQGPQTLLQTAADSSSEPVDNVVVTGTRITRTGFTAPTPVTVIGKDDIDTGARQDIASLINTMPEVRGSFTPTSTTNQALVGSGNFLDLRGLGDVRTLVLVDGKRFVPENRYGDVDIDVIPQALIGNVEIVTGGASAAWGSNAVAGVVNLRLNHDLDGFKANIQGGRTDHDDNRNFLVSLAYGSKFDDDRIKLLVGAEYAYNDGIPSLLSRDWGRAGWGIISNPNATPTNGQPAQLLLPDVTMANSTSGGLITSGPLKGIQFGPGGTPVPFHYGSLTTTSTMIGGDGENTAGDFVLEAPLRRDSVYGRLSFKMSDLFTPYAEFSYAETSSTVPSNVIPNDQVTIYRDNAFLPPSIGAAMNQLGIPSFTMGRLASDYAHEVYQPSYRTVRVVAGFDGALRGTWTWQGYYTHGQTAQDTHWTNRDNANWALAVDAVTDPLTGAAVCRSTLTNPNNGCQPLNLFGAGSPSQAAINYVMIDTFIDTNVTQDAAELTVQGDPFSTRAGPVSVVLGGDYRREETAITSGPLSQPGILFDANQTPWSGVVRTTEEFVESVVPLARNHPWVKQLDANLAARLTDYNTSGSVTTWKGGATYDINDSVRLRATRSRDIRAPNASELFALGGQVGHFPILDPVTGISASLPEFSNGNPDLKPETADTTTAGIVLRPSFIPRLRLSLDYYDIKVHGAIITFGPQTIVDLCATSEPSLCSLVQRVNGQITAINNTPRNLQEQHIDGADFELAYSLALDDVVKGWAGELTFRGLGTYVGSITLEDTSGARLQLAGSMEQPTIQSIGGQPHWRGNLTTNYNVGPASLSLTARYVGGGNLRNEWGPLQINQVTSGSRTYLDLYARRQILSEGSRSVDLFLGVENLTNLNPPITGQGSVTTRALYDVIGRNYTAGARLQF